MRGWSSNNPSGVSSRKGRSQANHAPAPAIAKYSEASTMPAAVEITWCSTMLVKVAMRGTPSSAANSAIPRNCQMLPGM